MKLEQLSQHWIQLLEQRKGRMPYSFVVYLLGIGFAMIGFALLDRVWAYGIEGTLVLGAGVVLFVVETCWRRITELKAFLSEYRKAERSLGFEAASPMAEPSPTDSELAVDLADCEEQSVARGEYEQFELLR